MAYHDAFWIVVGGAAPVIALAGVVSMSDMMDQRLEWGRYAQTQPRGIVKELTRRTSLGTLTKLMVWAQAMILVVQALMLMAALASLTITTNVVPPWVATVGEVLGLAQLAMGAIASYRAKATRLSLRDEMDG